MPFKTILIALFAMAALSGRGSAQWQDSTASPPWRPQKSSGGSSIAVGGFLESRADLDGLLRGTGVCEDFEGFNVPDGQLVATSCPVVHCDSICSSQGPGLVKCGVFYVGSSGATVVWLGKDFEKMPSRAVRSGTFFAVTFPEAVEAMGLQVRAENDRAYTFRVDITDKDFNFVDSKEFEVKDAPGIFVGYHNPGGLIKEVHLTSFVGGFPVVDDHCFGNPPPPCDGDEKFKAKCKAQSCGNEVKAALKRAEPDRDVTFRLDGGDDQIKNLGPKGKAKVKWCPVSAGPHTVEIVECALSRSATCK